MTIRNIILSCGLAGLISFSACSKKTIINPETPVVTSPAAAPYSITEGFESGTKPGYCDRLGYFPDDQHDPAGTEQQSENLGVF